MNTLIKRYLSSPNDFQLNLLTSSVFHEQDNHIFGFDEFSPGSISPIDESCFSSEESENDFKEKDHSDEILNFISQMLMEEEDLEKKPCMLHDCLALQATEKSLLNVLNNEDRESPNDHLNNDLNEDRESPNDHLNNDLNEDRESPNDHFTKSCSINSSNGSSSDISASFHNIGDFESLSNTPSQIEYPLLSSISSKVSAKGQQIGSKSSSVTRGQNDHSVSPFSGDKKNRHREDFVEEQRSSKQFANNIVESVPLNLYDQVLLCSDSEPQSHKAINKSRKGSTRGRPRGGGTPQKSTIIKEVVDLRALLMQCAQAVASYDNRAVNNLLKTIRQHSSPHGDGTERLAYYFANALEARMAGTGTASSYAAAALSSTRISAAVILNAYKTFITACPFRKMSNVFANKTIRKLADGATTLHIIDFGILYGFQWPCLIQALSERPGGPPKLRITGIDFPQPGFRPAERVAETGCRLAKYCERFGVPFEYIPIAQRWETIKLEDLQIDRNNHELLVVNSVYRLHNVPDETVVANSPRDAVLNLIRKINPRIFIHGAVNGAYNTPFFLTRFREALFHFSSMFDMYEATVPREDPNRILFEEEVFAKDAMNTIACEGTERIDRPETYKQWGARNLRAGFWQLPLDQEVVKFVRRKVKMEYHKDFSVDEDGGWMLQGWKGRVIHAISYWQPLNK